MSKSRQPTKVDGRTTAEQIRNILELSGIENIKRWQELQKVVHDVCKEFFAPEWQWKDISNDVVVRAREAVQDREPLLQERPDIAHWFISKTQRSASYLHRQRLERSSALEPFIADPVDQSNAVDSPADLVSQDSGVTDARKRFDAVRNEWM